MKLLVTGATGFVGRALIDEMLRHDSYHIHAAVRNVDNDLPARVHQFEFDGMSFDTGWSDVLQDIDCIIHTAARVHIMSDSAKNPLEEFRTVNTNGTLNLAQQAADAGVKRFIYLSSIKVSGEYTLPNKSFNSYENTIPTDFYALSKYEAEKGLLKIAQDTHMDIVIIRPPLVYGPGVKANFLHMMKWLHKGIPLPLGAIRNKRSLVALDNLIDLIVTCIEHPSAANEIFLVSDGEDLSTTELLNRVSSALGKKPRLLSIDQKILEFGLGFFGKKALSQRLSASLQADIGKTKKILNWTPPVSVDEALRKTAEHFLSHNTNE